MNAHPHPDAERRGVARRAQRHHRQRGLAAGRLEEAGVELFTDTDTEVLAHLIGRSEAETLEEKVAEALALVEGTYGLAVLDSGVPDRIVVARYGSPLLIGVGEKEMHVASDLAALVRYTTQVAHLDDGELATITADGFTTFRQDLTKVARRGHRRRRRPGVVRRRGARVLHAQGDARAARRRRAGAPGPARRAVRHLAPRRSRSGRRGSCGRSGGSRCWAAGRPTTSADGRRAGGGAGPYPADAEPASEFRYRNPIIEPDTLYVAVSQSGETIDTLLAVQEIRRKGGRVVGLVNVVGSAIARECDGGIYLHAGPEIAVASTKALTTMYLAFALLALQLGRVRDLSIADGRRLVAGLARLPAQLGEVLEQEDALAAVAGRLAEAENLFFIGRVRGYPVAREGAQKFKEISYRHAEAYETSELKHGPLALIDRIAPDRRRRAGRRADRAQRRGAARDRRTGGPLVVVTQPRSTWRPADPGRRCTGSTSSATSGSSTRSYDRGRCSCWPTTPPSRSATTSTSRATWPSPSPSSDVGRDTVWR